MVCSDNRRYSWQVAPQQSPLPLLTDVAKIVEIENVKSGKCKENCQKNIPGNAKKKRTKKRNNRNGLSPIVYLMIGF